MTDGHRSRLTLKGGQPHDPGCPAPTARLRLWKSDRVRERSRPSPCWLLRPCRSLSNLFRDVVVGLLRHANVAITDWRDPYYVPKSRGEFGLAENISYVLEMIRAIGHGHVIGICQGAVSALAATALLSTLDEAVAPRSLTLIAGPIDPLANPTRVGLASRAFPPEFQQNVMRTVPDRPRPGRRIYPANAQFTALMGYLARHGLLGEVFWKLWQDDGEDPRFPFSGLLMRLM